MIINVRAFLAGFLGLLLANTIFAGILWFISKYHEVQFHDTSELLKILLYIPPIIVNITWLICIFSYFVNGKRPKNKLSINRTAFSSAIARPTGDNAGGLINNFNSNYHRTRDFLFFGSLLSLLIMLFTYAMTTNIFDTVEIEYHRFYVDPAYKDVYPEYESYNNEWVKSIRSEGIVKLSERLEHYLSQEENITFLKSYPDEIGNWQSVFTSNLDCFKPEKQLFNQSQTGSVKIYNEMGQSFSYMKPFLEENYEYWIDPENYENFEIRYHYYKYYEQTSIPPSSTVICKYDIAKQRFEFVGHEYLMESMQFKYLVYDSMSGEMHFEYDSPISNILVQNKTLFYIFWYIIGAIVILLTIIVLKKLAKSGILNKHKIFAYNYNVKHTRPRNFTVQKLLPCPPKLQNTDTQDEPKDDI